MAKKIPSKPAPRTPAQARSPAARPQQAPRAAAQDAKYGRKLIGVADLAAEERKLRALKAEARAERTTRPVKANQVLAAVDLRLAQVATEAKARAAEGSAKLSDGTAVADYAASLQGLSGPELKAAAKAARAEGGADAQLRLDALRREEARRQGEGERTLATSERQRLATVKDAYAKEVSGFDRAGLSAERRAQQARVESGQRRLEGARRSGDPERIARAEEALRTAYARRAVVDAKVEVPADAREVKRFAARLARMTPEQLTARGAALATELTELSTGAIRGTREQLATVRGKQQALQAELARRSGRPADPQVPTTGPVRPLDGTRNPGNVIFDGPGMMVDSASSMPPEAWAQKLKAAGVTYVMLQIHNGGTAREDNLAALEAGWADKMRAAGLKVGFWGVSYTEPETDARLGAALTAKYRADFYVANCEGDYQDKQGDPGRNKRFVDAFQAEATAQGIGKIPRALSSMGRVALDMKPWIDNGWDAMPQGYWNSYEHYQPSLCVKFYEEWGWPKERIHPTIATYDGQSEGKARPKSIAEYHQDLVASGTTGFSFYLPESYLDGAGFEALRQGIASGMNGPQR